MEHRCQTRKPHIADVVIRNHDKTEVFGQSRNISLGGMFVDFMDGKVAVNTCVQVTVGRLVNKQREFFSTPAFVIHSGESSAGLMFFDLDTKAENALRAILSDSTESSLFPLTFPGKISG